MSLFSRGDRNRDHSDDNRPATTREQRSYQQRQARAAARVERRDGLAAEFDRVQRERGGGR